MRLTARQYEAIDAITKGISIEQQAKDRHVSPETIRYHIKCAYHVLNVHSREDAIYAFRMYRAEPHPPTEPTTFDPFQGMPHSRRK